MCHFNRSTEFDFESFLEMFDLSEAKLNQLLLTWRKVFSKSDTDLGRTSLVQHHIKLTDDIPVKPRHRKIAPTMYEEVWMQDWCDP